MSREIDKTDRFLYLCVNKKKDRLLRKQYKLSKVRKETKMKNLEVIGLKKNKKVTDALHQLLADYHIYYANLRGYHWNIKGCGFFSMHAKFEELYDAASEEIDVIAERLLQLDEIPENKIDKLALQAKLTAKGQPEPSEEMIKDVMEDLKYIIAAVRHLVELTDEAGDTVTNDIMMGILPSLEKKVWMINAFRS